MKSLTRHERFVLVLCLLVAGVFRLMNLDGPVDEPSWRQADTGYMALRMAGETPPEILKPKAPFRGNTDIKAAEFPVYPLVVSLGYKMLGREDLVWARLVTMLFFVGSVIYLFLLLQAMLGERVAWFSTAVYVSLPLGLFYSRAIHPDFCIIFFCHAYAWHAWRGLDSGSKSHYLLAVIAASLAFLMKAPYCFYLALPITFFLIRKHKRIVWGQILTLGSIFILPLILAVWFNHHRVNLEAGFEESVLYPMKWTTEAIQERFFGTLDQRYSLALWKATLRAVVFTVTTPLGVFLVALSLCISWSNVTAPGTWAVWGWILGVGLYVLLLFPMLDVHHWYLIPLMAPVSMLCGIFLDAISRAGEERKEMRASLCIALTLIFIWCGSLYGLKRGHYFNVDWQRHEAARIMQEQTQADDLVVSVTLGRSTGWSDPRILYFAHQRGWAVELKDLTGEKLERFKSAGASKISLLITPQHTISEEAYPVLAAYPHEPFTMEDPSGTPIGWVVMFDLDVEPEESNGPDV